MRDDPVALHCPFRWRGLTRDRIALGQTAKPTERPEDSRFTDPGERFLAPWYRAMWPVLPFDVDRFRPRQIAAALGLDRIDPNAPVPYEQRPATRVQGTGDGPVLVEGVTTRG